jgi:hypothetical protein
MSYISYKKDTDIYEESQQLRLCQILLSKGYQVYVEPSAIMPPIIKQDLLDRYKGRIEFVSRTQLAKQGVEVIEVNQ